MAEIRIQEAVDRIAIKTTELMGIIKADKGTTLASISALTTSLSDLTNALNNIKTKKVDKQITQNLDYSTISELREKLNSDSLASISLATGNLITGRTVNLGTGNGSIFISGFMSMISGIDLYGQFEIKADFSVVGGSEIPKEIRKTDITSTYLTRQWTPADIGKKMIISYKEGTQNNSMSGPLGFSQNNYFVSQIVDRFNNVYWIDTRSKVRIHETSTATIKSEQDIYLVEIFE